MGLHCQQSVPVIRDLGPHHNVLHIFQGIGDLGAAGDFPHAGVAFRIGQDDNVPGEIRGMSAAQVQQHAVLAGNRINFHFGNYGCH